jgi:16S rRNA (adenine1518-N6/adenine1519-N6)-dimethyltransferase
MTLSLSRSANQWRRILRSRNVRPTRSMGQNFLVEPDVVRMIADTAGIEPGALVIEIGPGMGILTRELLSRGATVVGVELDRELAAFLKEDLGSIESFWLVERDARYVEIDAVTHGRPYQVAANLPYSMATVIIRHFMESPTPPTRMTVMVQREVAERMTADPPAMSLLGLATDLYAEAEIAFIVPPDVFLPPPKVESAVVALDVRPELRGDEATRDRMFELATMAFQRKRKTLSNGLSMGLDRPKAELDTTLQDAGIDPMRRPQTLTVDDWLAIARALPA